MKKNDQRRKWRGWVTGANGVATDSRLPGAEGEPRKWSHCLSELKDAVTGAVYLNGSPLCSFKVILSCFKGHCAGRSY